MLLIGGAARSVAVQRVAADLFGVPVRVPPAREYVALGAARQAAWALAAQDGGERPTWRTGEPVVREPTNPEAGTQVREAYGAFRRTVHPPENRRT